MRNDVPGKKRPNISPRMKTIHGVRNKERLIRAKRTFKDNTDPDSDFDMGKLILPVREIKRPERWLKD